MAKEIERKFLVTDQSYRAMATGRREMSQGYLSVFPGATVRVRVADDRGYLTVKGVTVGAVREEFEYEIPVDDAREMLSLCGGRVLAKTRWLVPGPDGRIWEVDEFHGALGHLTLAEVELPEADAPVVLPPFVGEEVTGRPEYYNSSLIPG